MNVNSLRDEDNDNGFYFATCPTAMDADWPGAIIYESLDGGTSFQAILQSKGKTPLGKVTNALGDYQGGNTVDELNVINVTLTWGELSSTDYAGLLAGANACVVGKEIIYFRQAVKIGNLTYQLRGLLRGRRGSEYAIAGHVANEPFVFYQAGTWVRYVPAKSTVGIAAQYRGGTAGFPMEASVVKNFVNQASGLKCYAPVHLGGGRNGIGDLTLTWTRRTRIKGAWLDSVDVELGESAEAYEVEIFTSSSYTTVKRTITGLTAPTATYTAAQQVADFGAVQSNVYWRVYQMSSAIGRGFPATGQFSAGLGGAVAPPAPAPAPAPAPPPAPGPGGYDVSGALPAKVFACYFTTWDTQYDITAVPLDFNVIYLFHARPQGPLLNDPTYGYQTYNNTGDGTFFMPNFGESQITPAKVQQVRARGQKVILTVGGASAGYNFDTREKSTNFVNSFKSMYTALGGVDGIDFNNFEAGIGSTPSEMIWISQQLVDEYGNGFAITCPPAPDGSYAPGDRTLTLALKNAGLLTCAGPQYYDWSGFKTANVVKNYTDQWVAHLGNASQVMVGLSANYSFDKALTLQECIREWNAVKAAHPTIRGMFCWSAQTNISGGNQWGSTMKSLL